MNWKNIIKDIIIIFGMVIIVNILLDIYFDLKVWQVMIITFPIVSAIKILLDKYGDVKPFENKEDRKNL